MKKNAPGHQGTEVPPVHSMYRYILDEGAWHGRDPSGVYYLLDVSQLQTHPLCCEWRRLLICKHLVPWIDNLLHEDKVGN